MFYSLYACFLLQCLCEYAHNLFGFILIKLIYPVLILNFYEIFLTFIILIFVFYVTAFSWLQTEIANELR